MAKNRKPLPIETKNLTKKFGNLRAVNKVNLKVKKGEIYALIGPNGAGKTTVIKMLVGLLSPTKGTAEVFGMDIRKHPKEAKGKFGYISDNPSAYGFLTGMEFLELTASLRGLKEEKARKRIKKLTFLFPIKKILSQQMDQYSRGNRQKVAFLAALLSDPELLIIDEPVAGLDPESIEIFGKELRKFAKKGGAVLFVTHILSFGQKYADRVTLMDEGSIITERKVKKEASLKSVYQSKKK